MSGSAEPTTAELHLGDRLAALIDGELEDEARERVLAHLATCAGCKAEADGQRRVKSVFAGTAPPPPSDGLLARLQGLPATGSGLDADVDDMGGPRSSGSRPGFSFPLGQGGLTGGSSAGVLGSHRGLRTHRGMEVERVAARGRRFAFAAAGAFSLAAVALGGALTTEQSGTNGSTTASPSRASAAGVERSDRRGEQSLSNSASAARARPTTHSGHAPLTLRGSSHLGSEPRPVLTLGRDSAAMSDALRSSFSPRLGVGAVLSPPLMLAAYRAQPAEGASKNMPRPAGTPLALPSANGSPVGPSPGSGASVDVGAPGPSHAPDTSTMASNPRP